MSLDLGTRRLSTKIAERPLHAELAFGILLPNAYLLCLGKQHSPPARKRVNHHPVLETQRCWLIRAQDGVRHARTFSSTSWESADLCALGLLNDEKGEPSRDAVP
ncbi:hypothetical protein V8E53_015495 [Lactarius tabidus]